MSGCGPDCRQGGIRGVRLAEGSCRVAAGSEAAAGERDPAASRIPWARRALLGLLAIYKLGISPLLPPACRFYPTCSQYCREAVERHGIARGLWLGLRRLCRCHPLSKGGLDPVP